MEKEFKKWLNEFKNKYPLLREEANEQYELAMDEINEGGSPSHEFENVKSYLTELAKDYD